MIGMLVLSFIVIYIDIFYLFNILIDTIFFSLQWMKLDELIEQERNIRIAMSNRVGVLGLLLHQTVDHDPLTPIKAPFLND